MYKTWVNLPRDKWKMLDEYGTTNKTINAMIDLVVNYGLLDEVQYHDITYDRSSNDNVKRTVIVNNQEYEDLVDTVGHRSYKYSLQRLVNLVIDEGLIDDAMTNSTLVIVDNKEELQQVLDSTIDGLNKLMVYMPEAMTHNVMATLNELSNYRGTLKKVSNENEV